MFFKPKFNGGAIDNQTLEQKQENYSFLEIVAKANPVIWKEKTIDEWNKYSIREQDGSSSCVMQSYAKELEIYIKQKYNEDVIFSASFPYQNRANTEIEGSTTTDLIQVTKSLGNIPEILMPSQNMSEKEIMAVDYKKYFDDISKPFTAKRIFTSIDFDEVASIIQTTGKGVHLWFDFVTKEFNQDIPKLINGSKIISRHAVVAVDAVLYKGVQYLVIEDSWGKKYGFNSRRLISREFFMTRGVISSYIMVFNTYNVVNRPIFNGTISSLQDCLKYEQLFPSNVDSTGIFGSITKSALIEFQRRYNISPSVGFLGNITKAKLYEIYK